MPREGTKTDIEFFYHPVQSIEIRYAPGGDENMPKQIQQVTHFLLRLDMPREGTKTNIFWSTKNIVSIEIRYAPGGDENL